MLCQILFAIIHPYQSLTHWLPDIWAQGLHEIPGKMAALLRFHNAFLEMKNKQTSTAAISEKLIVCKANIPTLQKNHVLMVNLGKILERENCNHKKQMNTPIIQIFKQWPQDNC